MCTSVCRICLVSNVKMFYILNDPYLEVYEKLTSAELISVDRPQGVCYICVALLQRCCRFSEMARRSEQILTDMFNCGVEMTQQNILTFVCEVKNNNMIDLIIRPTQITTVNRYDTVETSVVNIKQEPLPVKEENTLSIDYVLKEESTETEEITNNNSSANDSIATVLNEPNAVTPNNLLSEDEQYEEDRTIDKDIHDNVSQLIFKSSFIDKTDVKQTKVNLFPCDHCTVTFSNKLNLMLHIKRTHRKVNKSKTQENYFEEKIYQASFKTGTIRKQPKVNMFPCDRCTVTFRNKMFLIAHKKLTHQTDSFKLKGNKIQRQDCFEKILTANNTFHGKQHSKTFSNNNTLNDHMKTHTEGKKFICEMCGIYSGSLCALRIHIRTHTGEKPYSCDHCHKKFISKSEVVLHMRIHTGEKPYSCTHCGKSFSQAGTLGVHKKTHSGEKPYACLQCDLRFNRNCSLVKHVKTHTSREKRYVCQQCNKGFYANHHLTRHNRIHTGEKPHACEMCPKSFSQRSDLVIHVRTHTGEKPYSCTQCDRTFPTSSSLVKHKRTHSGEKP